MNNNTNCEYPFLNFFTKISSIGPVHLSKILNHFGSAQNAYASHDYSACSLSPEMIDDIQFSKNNFDLEYELSILKKEQIHMISLYDDLYPRRLKEITTPPQLLYYKGNPNLLNDAFSIAIVGSRKCTPYGKIACEKIVPPLVTAGFTTVSGMALGIDTCIHTATLHSNGHTIAVLGSGLDAQSIYPRSNFQLSEKIIESGGLLLSEYGYNTSPLPFHFPIRNRIISGISIGTLVIEAGIKSGSLITAYTALEQNREVYAVPGPIMSSFSAGTNVLIQKGARLVQSAEDILSDLNLGNIQRQRTAQQSLLLTQNEDTLLNVLTSELDIDNLVKLSKLPISSVTSTLSLLEIKGFVKRTGPQRYVKL